MSALSGRERVRRALRGEDVDYPPSGPLAVHFCARDAGASLERYSTDAAVLAGCVARYYERYRPDAVWLSADTWVAAEALGAEVACPSADQPLCGTGKPVVRTARDVDRLPRPDPGTQGRMPLMIEALERLSSAVGPDAFVVACFDQLPFSLACELMGIERLMVAVIDDRPLVEALLARCVEVSVSYAKALARAGADMLSAGDSPAGLVGPERYRDIALPAEQRVFRRLREAVDVPLSLHICGDTRMILEDMASSGSDVIEFDHQVPPDVACAAVGRAVALWGNLDPVGVLAMGDAHHVRRASLDVLRDVGKRDHRRFVLSSGCTLAVETPRENVRALVEAGRQWVDERRDDCRTGGRA